jgi:hypothetical protein
MIYLAAFVALAVLDFVWAEYVASVNSSSPFVAGVWSVPIYAISAGVTIEVVHQPWLILPACLGCFVGTYASVWWKRKKSLDATFRTDQSCR